MVMGAEGEAPWGNGSGVDAGTDGGSPEAGRLACWLGAVALTGWDEEAVSDACVLSLEDEDPVVECWEECLGGDFFFEPDPFFPPSEECEEVVPDLEGFADDEEVPLRFFPEPPEERSVSRDGVGVALLLRKSSFFCASVNSARSRGVATARSMTTCRRAGITRMTAFLGCTRRILSGFFTF
jgi:hypothetical protein